MKYIATFILIVLVQTSFGQIADNTDRHNENNIYYQALLKYLDFRAADKIDTLFILKDTKTTDSLLSQIGSTKIVMIEDTYNFINSRKDKTETLYSIFPMDFERGEFWVSFVPFSVTIDKKRKRGLLLSNPGSYKVVFRYDKGKFQFVRMEDHGI